MMSRETRGTWLKPQVSASFPAHRFITGVEEIVLVCGFVLFSNTLPNLLPSMMRQPRGVGTEAFEPPTLVPAVHSSQLQTAPVAALGGRRDPRAGPHPSRV